MTTTLTIASILFLITIVLSSYHLMYKREVERIEKNMGIALPAHVYKLLQTITILSFALLTIIAVIIIGTMLSNAS